MTARGSNATMETSGGDGSISACDPGGTLEADVGSGQLGIDEATVTKYLSEKPGAEVDQRASGPSVFSASGPLPETARAAYSTLLFMVNCVQANGGLYGDAQRSMDEETGPGRMSNNCVSSSPA